MDRTDQITGTHAEARRHLDARDGESALILLEEASADDPAAEMLRARAHLLLEAPGRALAALRRAGLAGADPAEVAAAYDGLDPKALPPDPEARLLTWLTGRIERFDLLLRLARVQMRRRRFGKAEAAARRAVALDPGAGRAHRLLYMAVLRSDAPERAVAVIRAALERAEDYPNFPALKMTLAGLEVADREALTAAIDARWPGKLLANLRTGDLALHGEGATGSKEQRAYELALRGETEAAMALARAVEAENVGRHASIRKELAGRVIAAIPGPDAWRRPLIEDDGAEVIRSAPSQTGVTLLGMTDLAHHLGYPIRVIDAFCAATGAASLFLRDHSYRLFIGGVGTLGPDRATTLEALRSELVALGTERLIVMGQSSGGFSALSYGRELGAAAIYGFSIPSSIGRFLSGPDSRARALIGKLNRTFPPEALDLNVVLPPLPSRAPIELHYGADRDTDRGHAEDLAGQEGVTLHPMAGHNHHQVMPQLIADGRFRSWLEP